MLTFNDLIVKAGIDPDDVNIIRHTPDTLEMKRIFPWLASERPDLFYMYQSTHGPRREAMFLKRNYAVSFVVTEINETVFVGCYKIGNHKRISRDEFSANPLGAELYKLGAAEITQSSRLQFELDELDVFKDYKGRIVLDWTSGKRSFIQIMGAWEYAISSIYTKSVLVPSLASWDEILLTFTELRNLPSSWREKMTQWRGVYLITDRLDGKQYVGSAYGEDNLLQRWMSYAATGHGNNRDLKNRNPDNFLFSILQLVSPTEEPDIVISLETNWKKRLLTKEFGLNAN